MSTSNITKEVIWVSRLLYLTMFLTLVISWDMFHSFIIISSFHHFSYCLPYLMAIIILVYSGLVIANEEEAWEELNDMYLEEIAGYYSVKDEIEKEEE